jgi:ribosome biogenesis protein Nip4
MAKGMKTGGRQKGTVNWKTLEIVEAVARTGCNPGMVLCHFTNGDWKSLGYEAEHYFTEKADGAVKLNYVISPEMRLNAAKELCKYLYVQKKAVEVSADESKGFTIVVKDYLTKGE